MWPRKTIGAGILSKRALFIIFCLLDLLIAFAFCELWARAFVKEVNLIWVHDNRLGIMLAPNQERIGYVEGKYYNIVRTNNYGFVDDDWRKEKPRGVIRIEAYGDSFLAGLQTNLTLTSYLEKFLNESAHNRYDVMNFGMVNGGTAKELACYEVLGKKFEHDYVMLFFMVNDIRDNNSKISVAGNTNPYYQQDYQGNLKFVRPQFDPESKIIKFLKNHIFLSHVFANKFLASELFQHIEWVKKQIQKKNVTSTSNDNQNEYERAVKITFRLIDEFNRRVKENNAQLTLLDCENLTHRMRHYFTHEQMKDFCIKRGIKYIPVYPVYEKLRENKSKYVFLDGHLKSEGNKIIARAIFEKIKQDLRLRKVAGQQSLTNR